MAGQLIPLPESAPPSVKHLPLEKRVQLWAGLLDESEALLLSGLRARIGPHGDLKQAYREWNARRINDHDRALVRMAERAAERKRQHGQ